jgi:hypothetical protein
LDRRLALDDQAASQILGFIVGLAVVTSSLAIATYFITSVPDNSPDEESQRLQAEVTRGIEVLTTTPGEPKDWGENYDADTLRRVGLLLENEPERASLEKIQRIQDGDLTRRQILDSWDLNDNERELRIEGRVQSVPIGDPPGVEAFGVVQTNDGFPFPAVQNSKQAAEAYASANPSYQYDMYDWKFQKDNPPVDGSGSMGNTVPDRAFHVETTLIPKMAGLAGTYHVADHGSGDWYDASAAEQAYKDYSQDTSDPISSTSWRVVTEGNPHGLPSSPPAGSGDHILTVNHRRDTGSDEGLGLWRVQDGARSVAVLPKVDVSEASSATLSFDQILMAEDNEAGDLYPDCSSLSETTCTMVRPSIVFWNTTSDEWSRLDDQAACGPSPAWDDVYDAEANGGSWTNDKTVDLCEAVNHTDDEMHLGFFWDTSCVGVSSNTTCAKDNAHRGWFIDDVEVEVDGSTSLDRDWEPPTQRAEKQLFVSSGVDHNRTYEEAPDHLEKNTMLYLRHAVENGSSAVALYPETGAPFGEWLSQIGLSTTPATDSEPVTTEVQDASVMRFPNDIPAEADDYQQDAHVWQTGDPSTPPQWSLPSDFQQLSVVQTGPDGEFLLEGEPYPDGGSLTALARNHTEFQNTTLREDLYDNLQSSAVFIDPTFTLGPRDRDAHLPDPGSAEVASERRVMLVSVTPNDQYVVPIEITMWMWDRG